MCVICARFHIEWHIGESKTAVFVLKVAILFRKKKTDEIVTDAITIKQKPVALGAMSPSLAGSQ